MKQLKWRKGKKEWFLPILLVTQAVSILGTALPRIREGEDANEAGQDI